jgi:hypothetical protein
MLCGSKMYLTAKTEPEIIPQEALASDSAQIMSETDHTAAAYPLEDAGILLNVLNSLGPGQHLFISPVSKTWKDSYERVASTQVAELASGYWEFALLRTVTSEDTLCSAAFASAASVKLAHDCGLDFGNEKVQRIAGRVADLSTLRAAHELGLQLTDEVLSGAAEAASVPKLQWLHSDQGCPLSSCITSYAARGGSTDTLRWLKRHGCAFIRSTFTGAAAGVDLRVLGYLRAHKCEWDDDACLIAARNGDASTLQWLHERGSPWSAEYICNVAAEIGSVEVLLYLKQQRREFDTLTMASAAAKGHLEACQFLMAEECPCDAWACAEAAAGGHLETVRFLHESGCPWDAAGMCASAAECGNIELLHYLISEGCSFNFTEDDMNTAAQRGHLLICQYLRAELCPWSTVTCERAAGGGSVDTLHWLREQGCPWDVHAVRLAAVSSSSLRTVKYILGAEPAASAAQLTELLSKAGSWSCLAVAKLRRRGADWPAELSCNGQPWRTKVRQWARSEGCTSPV